MSRLTSLSRSIDRKVALITGAASGMGRATAHLFSDEGATVIVSDLEQNAVDKVVDEIKANNGDALGMKLDVSSDEDRKRVAKSIVQEFGCLDILINNAGIALETDIDSQNYSDIWTKSIDVLLTAQAMLIRECLPMLKRSDGGRIVNIASPEGLGSS